MLIEYIRKRSKRSKIKNNPKRGIMLSYAAEGKVLIGFSLCHSKYDRYDFIKEMRVPNHGFKIALERATTWVGKDDFTIKGALGRNFSYRGSIIIPESIKKKVYKFITRTIQYYPDRVMPIWALRFKDYMECLDRDRRKPVKGDGSVRTAKGVRYADRLLNVKTEKGVFESPSFIEINGERCS